MRKTSSQAIYAGLLYGACFSYPLSYQQIGYWSVGKKISDVMLYKNLKQLLKKKNIFFSHGSYYVSGQKSACIEKIKKEQYSETKLKKAFLLSGILSKIPSILCITVTGTVAARSAGKNDDIDFLIVTADKCVWITRVILFIISRLFVRVRRYGDTDITDAGCFNMFLSIRTIELPLSDRTLYGAHEVLQMVPCFSIGNTYKKMLQSNIWSRTFLPNWYDKKISLIKEDAHISAGRKIMIIIFSLFDGFAYRMQLFYMKNKITDESISRDSIRFHPATTSVSVLKRYNTFCAKRNIPLDNGIRGS